MRMIKRAVVISLISVPAAMGIAGAANAGIGGGGGGALFNENASFAGPKGAAEWNITSIAGGDGWGFGGGWGGGFGGGALYEKDASFAGPYGAGELSLTSATLGGGF
ncbi:hypothetical protein ACQEU5_15285 [Marinactinospora thermotolerans]|uniref:Type I keratin, acidic n=1 Tax=Marinactinospora thermotolerans DSM 45154 TaxID=1122192 RepID=A0A1T4TIX3_9ACTN|nr:hypothetical protein [Marinactinospora thermotolerans]SKA40377.1 type I keratin, acidic [Marinactinospora thermotolerans DSM 45154]